MLLLDIFKSAISGIQFNFKENNQKHDHCENECERY